MDERRPWEEIYQAVGECLHAWGNVETDITHLFMLLHGHSWNVFDHPLRAAFEAVISFEARLSMIRATISADHTISSDYSAHFHTLQSKLTKSYRKRHEVAHFVLIGRGSTNSPVQSHAIRPFFNWNDFTNNVGPELNLKQIQERRKSFFDLSERISQHRQFVGKIKKLPADYFARPGDIAYPDL